MRLTKRLLSAILVLVMVFSMLPLQAFASEVHTEDGGGTKIPVQGVRPQKAPTEEKNTVLEKTITIKVGESVDVDCNLATKYLIHEWQSDNSRCASVEKKLLQQKATITGVSVGTTKIVESVVTDIWGHTEIVQIVTVNVITNATGITIPETLELVGVQTKKLDPTVTPTGAKGYEILWSSNNEQVAKVDQNGNVTSVGLGEATITAQIKDTDAVDTCTVTVKDVVTEEISLEDLMLLVGKTGKMNLTATPALPLNPQITWEIQDSNIAAIDQEGVVTANQEGETQVTVTLQVGEKVFTATAKVTVVTKTPPDEIKLNKEELTLNPLAKEKLVATLTPDGDINRELTWTSSNPAAVTVDENGEVTAVAPGSATITVTTVNGLKATCDVTVRAFEPQEEDTTTVYVYLKITDNSGGNKTEGWKVNKDGWYTIGELTVPNDVLGKPGKGSKNPGAEVLKPYLPYIKIGKFNSDVATTVPWDACTWVLHAVENGATDYVGSGYTWHLDGQYEIPKTPDPVKCSYTVNFVDQYYNPIPGSEVITGVVDQYKPVEFTIPHFDGYTFDNIKGLKPEEGSKYSFVVMEDNTVVNVVYKANEQYYTVEYRDKDTKESIFSSVKNTAQYGEKIRVSTITIPTIPNYTFDSSNPTDVLVVGRNNGENVITLYYTRNQYDVTYKYFNPRTGEEVIVGLTKEGAGLTVKAEPKPTIDGYEFVGWTDIDKTNQVTIDENGEFTMPNRNVTFTGSFTVPETQNYAVRATVKLGGAVLATAQDTKVTWTELGSYYDMGADGLLDAFWGTNVTGSTSSDPDWTPDDPDAAKQYDAGKDEAYHEVIITLEENSPALVTLTYDGNGEEVTGVPGVVKTIKGESVQISSTPPTRPGYTFKGWNTEKNGAGNQYGGENGATTITLDQSTTLYAQWEAKTAIYTVQHHFQDLNDPTKYTHDAEQNETHTGNVGEKTNATAKDVAGFTAQSFKQREITADNKTVVVIKYDRNSYNVNFTLSEDSDLKELPQGVTLPNGGPVAFGSTVAFEDLNVPGYTFTWTEVVPEGKEKVTITKQDGNNTFTMPDRDVTIEGKFTVPETQNYAVRATVKLGNEVLATAEKKAISWTVLKGYYDMGADALLNTFWGTNVTGSTSSDPDWTPDDPDAAKQYDAGKDEAYHEVIITLQENSPALVTLAYNANGGVGEGLPETQTYLKGTKATVTEAKPTRTGYAFTGWNTKQDGTGTLYAAKAKITLNESTTLYAQWEQMYKVTYRFDDSAPAGAVVPTDNTYYKAGTDNVEVKQPDPVDNYDFLGWTNEAGDMVSGTMKMPDYDVTLTGSWAPKTATYTVKHYLETETDGQYPDEATYTDAEVTVSIGTVIKRENVTKSYDGYELDTVKTDDTFTIGADSADNVIKVYYKRSAYTVTYQVDGEQYERPYTVRYGTKHVLISEPTKDGHSFSHWSVVGDSATIETGAEGKYITMPAGNVTIEGSFSLNQYKVSYEYGTGNEYNGERNLPNSHEENYGATNFLAAAPTETGYVFSGWYQDEACENPFPDDYTMPAENVIAYGKFTKRQDISYTVRYLLKDSVIPANGTDFKTVENQTFGAEVKETAPLFDGYTPVDPTTQTLKLTADSDSNVITFYYYKNITVTAESTSKAYGAPVPELQATVSEDLVKDGDEITYSLSTTATQESPVKDGGYPIEVTGEEVQGYYKVTFVSGTLTIQPAGSLSVQPVSYEGVYDGQTYGGEAAVFVKGEKFTDATVTYYVSDSLNGPWEKLDSYPTIKDVDEFYVMVVAEHNNYNTAVEYAHLRVIPRTVTVTAGNAEKVYGDVDPTSFAAQVDGLLGGDTIDYQVARAEGEDADKYDITPTGEQNQGNYVVQYYSGEFTINPKPINVKADNQTMTYGGDVPALTARLAEGSALAGRDAEKTLAEVIGGYTMNVQYKDGEPNVGEHPIVFVDENGVRGNYDVTFVSGTLTIQPAESLSVQPFSYEGIYDGQSHGGEAAVFVKGEKFTDATVSYYVSDSMDGPWEKQNSYPTIQNVGEFYVMVVAEHNNYNTAVDYAHFQVTPKEVTITAPQPIPVVYGQPMPVLAPTVAPTVQELPDDFYETVDYDMVCEATSTSPAGEYPISFTRDGQTVEGLVKYGNYDVTFVSGKLIITKADGLSISAKGGSWTYDGEFHGDVDVDVNLPGATLTYSTDGIAYAEDAPTIKDVSESGKTFYVKASLANYKDDIAEYTLTVTPKLVTVTSASGEKVYDGTPLTAGMKSETGWVGEEGAEYTFHASVTDVTTGEGVPNTFSYEAKEGTNLDNYLIKMVNGSLKVNPKPIKVKADDKGMTYGGDVPALTAQLEEGSALADRDAEKTLEAVIGKYTLEVQLPQDRPLVGRHTIDFKDEDGVRGNYLVTFVPGELTIEAPTSGEGTGIVTKTHEDKTYNPGEWVRFTISAANIYNQPATLTIVEQLENVVFDKVENVRMAPGETLTFEAQYQVTEADILRGSLSNTIDWTIAPNEGSSIGGTVTDPVDLAGRNSAMTVGKTIEDQKDSYRVGDVISFQILVKNTGNVTLHNLELTDRLINANGRVTFTETNGASLSGGKLLLAQLAPGQQWTVKCSYTVTEADAGKNIGNAATVTPEDGPTITDETDKPAPVEQRYTLTIRYLNTAGLSIHPDYTGRYHAGDRYEITSPAVAGYTLTADSVVRSGVMGEGDKTLVVVYDRVPAPAPDPDPEPAPDPAPDPDPDPDPAPNPDPDAPAPDPDPDPEADPAQQTEPQDNTEPVLQPGTYLEDPEDHTLTPIDEEETPLANVNLNGHTCCILHFLLMLAAMVVYGFDTKSRKKHQARIFELKRQLAMKDDQNDSQQS